MKNANKNNLEKNRKTSDVKKRRMEESRKIKRNSRRMKKYFRRN